MKEMDKKSIRLQELVDAIYARRSKGRIEGIRVAWMKFSNEEMRLREKNNK